MPDGLLVTVPLPVPALPTVNVWFPGAEKVAVTDLAASIVTVQVPVPEQPAPFQPIKVAGAVGVAVSVTEVFLAKAYKQVEPQLMPDGSLVTMPLSMPTLLTLNL